MINYYIILGVVISCVIGIQFAVELRRKSNAKKNGQETLCVYCGQPIDNKRFSMSYGWPGKLRVYKCRRWWCNLGKKLGYLEKKNYNNEEI